MNNMKWLIVSPMFLFIPAFIGLVIWLVIWSIRQEKKRRETLRVFAEGNGFEFLEKAADPQALGLPMIGLFKAGHSRHTSNILSGAFEGSAVRVFDYRYTTGSGKNSSTHHQTVVAVETGGALLPSFTLARENFFHKIGQAFGYQDIDFDDFPEFSKKYLLRGEDEEAIRDLFDVRIIDAYENGLACNVELRDGWLFVYQAGRRMKPEQFQPRIESAFAFLFELTGAA